MSDRGEVLERLRRHHKAGEVLFLEGEGGKELYLIQSGKVKIFKQSKGRTRTLAVLGRGEFFGEMALLTGRPRSASAEMISDGDLIVVDKSTFHSMIRSRAEIAERMLRKLAIRLAEANHRIDSLLYRDSTSRVVSSLVQMAKERGVEEAEEVKLEVEVSDDEGLAGVLGLTTDGVREILAKLAKGGVIRLEGSDVIVSSRAELEKFFEFLEMKDRFEWIAEPGK